MIRLPILICGNCLTLSKQEQLHSLCGTEHHSGDCISVVGSLVDRPVDLSSEQISRQPLLHQLLNQPFDHPITGSTSELPMQCSHYLHSSEERPSTSQERLSILDRSAVPSCAVAILCFHLLTVLNVLLFYFQP